MLGPIILPGSVYAISDLQDVCGILYGWGSKPQLCTKPLLVKFAIVKEMIVFAAKCMHFLQDHLSATYIILSFIH